MSRYLVTGGHGFIGSRLSCYLASKGHEVLILSRDRTNHEYTSFSCDIGYDELPHGLMEGVDGVFHLASMAHTDLSGPQAERCWRVNVTGTEALLQAAIDSGVSKFIYFSSVKAVAESEHCVDETWSACPTDIYGKSKREAEKLVVKAGLSSSMNVCNLRPALVYGPHVKGNLARMVHAVRSGFFPPLPNFRNRRSMVSVDDLIAAAYMSMNNDQVNGKTYFITDSVDYSTQMIYEAMRKNMGLPIPSWTMPNIVLNAGARVGDWVQAYLGCQMPLNSTILKRISGSACYSSGAMIRDTGWQASQTFFDVLPTMVQSVVCS